MGRKMPAFNPIEEKKANIESKLLTTLIRSAGRPGYLLPGSRFYCLCGNHVPMPHARLPLVVAKRAVVVPTGDKFSLIDQVRPVALHALVLNAQPAISVMIQVHESIPLFSGLGESL